MGRGAPGEVLVDGAHAIEDALAASVPFVGVVADERGEALARRIADRGATAYVAPSSLVEAASPVKSASGIVAIATWSPTDAGALLDLPSPVLVGLVGVQDPGNVGAIVRTADALGASGVLVLDDSAAPGGWRAIRGAMGSTFRIPIGRGSSAAVMADARRRGIKIVAAGADADTPLDRATIGPPVILLVGNEGSGLPPSVVGDADLRVAIPMRSGVDSLNVAVGTALLLWEAKRATT
jgi:TrmH family RNA methyltransferase